MGCGYVWGDGSCGDCGTDVKKKHIKRLKWLKTKGFAESADKWQVLRNPFLRPVTIALTTGKEVGVTIELLFCVSVTIGLLFLEIVEGGDRGTVVWNYLKLKSRQIHK